jgi:hypothetical protein
MPISPWYKGDTAPTWTFQLIPDSGAFSIAGLSPSNFSLIIRNVDLQRTPLAQGHSAISQRLH